MSSNRVRAAFVSLFRRFEWSRAVMMTRYGDGRQCELGAKAIRSEFHKNNVSVVEWIKVPLIYPGDVVVDEYLRKLKEAGRIIIICLELKDLRRVMYRAQKMGMTGGDYVYLYYTLILSNEMKRPWEDGKVMTTEQRANRIDPFRQLKHVSISHMDGLKEAAFYELIKQKLLEPPWNLNVYNSTVWKGSLPSLILHDATYLYLSVLNESLAQGKGHPDGKTFRKLATKQSFEGVTGRVVYDSNADRQPNYWLWGIGAGSDEFELMADIRVADSPQLQVQVREAMHWNTADGLPPPDTPDCGFFNELCPPKPKDTTIVTAVSTTGGVLTFIFLLVSAAAIYRYRTRKKEEQLLAMPWKINYADIVFTSTDFRSVLSMHMKSVRSMKGQSDALSMYSDGDSPPHAATYRDVTVSVQQISIASLVLARKDLVEINLRREMAHENITTFVGACIDPPNMCVLTTYCSKGSLQAILLNDDIRLDWVFKNSIILDIVKGMRYIHRSGLKSHGNLKSYTCLVDSRWTVKVSFFGLHSLTRVATLDCAEDESKYAELQWTAPELLRMCGLAPPGGTDKGDVYSFGIMLQEILFRNTPFFYSNISENDVIRRVLAAETPPYRPDFPDDITNIGESCVVELMVRCWNENPEYRPSFDDILKTLLKMHRGRQVNIMDNMVQKLEKYATNLEELVQHRTAELVEEKKKTDSLLYRMLPR
ncbi:hypothetical protein LSAT2_012004 [Lamellibrachia satsuma]|nr:hypothetical protein LSAT2_012004 [Lamellibrachia satsuma]